MKDDSQDNLQKQPYISLQKLGENKFVRGITTLVGFFGGIIGAYTISKIINHSQLGGVDAAEVQKNLNNTKSIESVLTEEQAEKTTVNHNSKIEQLYEKIVSPYIKDMSDSERKATLIKILNRHQILGDKYNIGFLLPEEITYFKDNGVCYKEVFIPESEGGGPGGCVSIKPCPRGETTTNAKGTKHDPPTYFSEEISPVQEWWNQEIIWIKTTVKTDDETLIFTLPWVVADAAGLQKNLNETKSIESVLTDGQAETTANNIPQIKQLYDETVSQHVKDMPDLQIRSKIAVIATRRGIDTTKSQRYSILNFNDYLFRV